MFIKQLRGMEDKRAPAGKYLGAREASAGLGA